MITDAILHRIPVAPLRINPDLPPDLEHVITRALEKDRNLRFQHAADMRAELQRIKRDISSVIVRGPETDTTAPPATPSPSISPAKPGDSGAKTPLPSTPSPTSSQLEPRKSEINAESLRPIEKYLATFLGPMSGIIVRRAAAEAQTYDQLFAALAAKLSSHKDRQAFLARKAEWLGAAAMRAPVKEDSSARRASQPAAAAAEFSPDALRHAAELLARYMGPVSRVLTDRAARRADSPRALYLLLGEHLKDPSERERFLRDAGFPE